MKKRNVYKLSSEGKKAEQSIKKAVAGVIADHKSKGIPIVVWEKGKVVKLNPQKYF